MNLGQLEQAVSRVDLALVLALSTSLGAFFFEGS